MVLASDIHILSLILFWDNFRFAMIVHSFPMPLLQSPLLTYNYTKNLKIQKSTVYNYESNFLLYQFFHPFFSIQNPSQDPVVPLLVMAPYPSRLTLRRGLASGFGEQPQCRSVWHFLLIRRRLCVWVDTRASSPPSVPGQGPRFIAGGINLKHLIKVMSSKCLHGEVTVFLCKWFRGDILWLWK